MEPLIRIENLDVRYRSFQALKNVNVEIPRNRITVIMGPSGCGKTTLLKSMNRLLDLTEGAQITGRVLLDGEDVYAPGVDVGEVRKRAGLLAQRPFPLPMSIYDNVAYGRRIHGIRDGRKDDEAVQHYLELAGLWGEVKDRLKSPAAAVDWTAAAAVPGARAGGRARSYPGRRADVCARSDLRAAHREPAARTEGAVHGRAGDARAAPGAAPGRLRDLHVPGGAGGGGSGGRSVQPAEGGTDTRLPGRCVLTARVGALARLPAAERASLHLPAATRARHCPFVSPKLNLPTRFDSADGEVLAAVTM